MQFWRLVKMNLIMLYRNGPGVFWTLIIPAAIYIALSILPIGMILGNANYSEFILPGIIALTIMQGGIYTLAYWIIELRHRGIIRQLSTTPINKFDFILSVLTARSIMMLLQAVILTLIGVVCFHITVSGSFPLIIVFVILGALVFLPLGLLISLVADSYEAAAPFSTGVGLPLTFLGNVFYPVAFLPGYLQVIAKYLPITFLADALRQLYVSDPDVSALLRDFIWLLIWLAITLGSTLYFFRIED